MGSSDAVLSLAELEAFDPHASARGTERRFCCPLCGDGKPKDKAHRSLGVSTQTGEWHCFRCNQKGKVRELWAERPQEQRHGCQGYRAGRPRPQRETVPPLPAPPPAETPEEAQRWRKRLPALVPITGTPGAAYLQARGIPLELATAARVRFHPAWEHWDEQDGRWVLTGATQRVAFAIRDRAGELVGIQARAITEPCLGPKADTRGQKQRGVFATPGAWEAPALVLTEAPIDALSLHLNGLPTLATLGTSLPEWMPRACALRPVLIATDADEAGDQAAATWEAALRPLGSQTRRLRPVGFKDWNAWLMTDPTGLRAFLAAEIAAAGLDGALSARPESAHLRNSDAGNQPPLSNSEPGSSFDSEPEAPAPDDTRIVVADPIGKLLRHVWEREAELLHAVDVPEGALSAVWRAVEEAADTGDLGATETACRAYLGRVEALAGDLTLRRYDRPLAA